MKRTCNILLSAIFLILITSCHSAKHDLSYFRDLDGKDSGVLTTVQHTNTIEPENQLVITVTSNVPEATADFNLPHVNPAAPGAIELNTTPQLKTYEVDNAGDIEFPRLGKIHVAGLTTYQLRDLLVEKISRYVKDPMVSVSMTGYRIVVMGEVKSPKTIVTSADRFSVLDALAEAGDLTDYALRDNILVLRQSADNQIEYHRINLHDSGITQSPFFWLRNNDVVIVSPNDIKEANSKYNQNNAYKLSVISTLVGMGSAIISLIIALTVK